MWLGRFALSYSSWKLFSGSLFHSLTLANICGMFLHEWAGLQCAVTGARKAGVLPMPGLWEEESLSWELTQHKHWIAVQGSLKGDLTGCLWARDSPAGDGTWTESWRMAERRWGEYVKWGNWSNQRVGVEECSPCAHVCTHTHTCMCLKQRIKLERQTRNGLWETCSFKGT